MVKHQCIHQVQTLRPQTGKGQCQGSATDSLCAFGIWQCCQSVSELRSPSWCRSPSSWATHPPEVSFSRLWAMASSIFSHLGRLRSYFDKRGFSCERNTISCLVNEAYISWVFDYLRHLYSHGYQGTKIQIQTLVSLIAAGLIPLKDMLKC